jgi:3' terminal RNA ribose 2'-O-methyltransferase Hen1
MNEDQFERVVGLDVSVQALERARDRLELDRRPPVLREKMDLLHGSLIYRDDRLTGFDAAALVEVVEHFEPERLPALERVVFGHASPQTVVVTTPNREYNVLFDPLAPDARRHYDHRFEWTRAEFRDWAADICEQFGYEVEFLPIGPEDPEHGAPTQMAMFTQAPA